MRSVRLLSPARDEVREALQYYEDQRAGLGLEFLQEIDSALLDIRENPECFPIVKYNIHRCLTQRFPYSLLYRMDSNEIIVLAVMHLRRRPNYWLKRI